MSLRGHVPLKVAKFILETANLISQCSLASINSAFIHASVSPEPWP